MPHSVISCVKYGPETYQTWWERNWELALESWTPLCSLCALELLVYVKVLEWLELWDFLYLCVWFVLFHQPCCRVLLFRIPFLVGKIHDGQTMMTLADRELTDICFKRNELNMSLQGNQWYVFPMIKFKI